MDKKLENYIEYIANDLINNTVIDERDIIRHDFIPAIEPWLLVRYTQATSLNPNIVDGLVGRYGLREEEIIHVWSAYRNKLQDIIKKQRDT